MINGFRLAQLACAAKGHLSGCAPRGALSVSSLMRFKHEIYYSDLLILCVVYVLHYRGRVRYNVWRQLSDHSTFTAPLNVFMYPVFPQLTTPYRKPEQFPRAGGTVGEWETIRDEGQKLMEIQQIKASDQFKHCRVQLVLQDRLETLLSEMVWRQPSFSAMTRARRPRTVAQSLPSVKAAMFAELPDGSRWPRAPVTAYSTRAYAGADYPQR